MGKIQYKGHPWVENVSRPNTISHGLQGRHLSLWASHGRYYDIGKGEWRWQRPFLFCTTEDLYTQTLVVPYLIPMLENAGANVFTPRERDWQRNEVIVDNDQRSSGYLEVTTKGSVETHGQARLRPPRWHLCRPGESLPGWISPPGEGPQAP